MLDREPHRAGSGESPTRQGARERLGRALHWLGLAMVSAPFVLTLVWIVAERVLGWIPGELPIAAFGVVPVLFGAIGALPFFLLVPWLNARIPWFDRSLSGALALSVLLSIPAALTPLVVWRGFAPLAPVWIVALGSIAVPRLVAKSLRRGAFSASPQ